MRSNFSRNFTVRTTSCCYGLLSRSLKIPLAYSLLPHSFPPQVNFFFPLDPCLTWSSPTQNLCSLHVLRPVASGEGEITGSSF